ncbi:hypothetical protein AXF42_Ash009778 [Apostasia shenzhenica]|uniref:Uncharacterized protein n=1 Tax=Apostasia shenzhenica TaxID=1088818 RepID=A0A2I0AX19_9ASPA|nr:hypothetical protein AXF42_Ash009778 [Apostasia shenzhenica]
MQKAKSSFQPRFTDPSAESFFKLVFSTPILILRPMNRNKVDDVINGIIDLNGWHKWLECCRTLCPHIETMIQVRGYKSEWTNLNQVAVYYLLKRRVFDIVEIILICMKECLHLNRQGSSIRSFRFGNIICDLFLSHYGFDLSREFVDKAYYSWSIDSFKLHQPKPSYRTMRPLASSQPSFSTAAVFTPQFANFLVEAIQEIREISKSNTEHFETLQVEVNSLVCHTNTLNGYFNTLNQVVSKIEVILLDLKKEVKAISDRLKASSSSKK